MPTVVVSPDHLPPTSTTSSGMKTRDKDHDGLEPANGDTQVISCTAQLYEQ